VFSMPRTESCQGKPYCWPPSAPSCRESMVANAYCVPCHWGAVLEHRWRDFLAGL
jgi:hypothetical protein